VSEDLIDWLRAQIDDDERWALACNRTYQYADVPAVPPASGVHWRWVAGDDWHTVTPDPVVDEFVAEPGYGCNLATVETWRSGRHEMPHTYANEIVEMDASAAGHIARHDPARVLREVEARRRLIDQYEAMRAGAEAAAGTILAGAAKVRLGACEMAVKIMALPFSDRPGYRSEWQP
jgi:hypothetical protein